MNSGDTLPHNGVGNPDLSSEDTMFYYSDDYRYRSSRELNSVVNGALQIMAKDKVESEKEQRLSERSSSQVATKRVAPETPEMI